MSKRAPKGGAYGANGEWYEGGRFINTIPENNKKSGSRKRTNRKVEIFPYRWVSATEVPEGHFRIFEIVGTIAGYIRNERGGIDDSENFPIEPYEPGCRHYGWTHKGHCVDDLCEMWNRGERFAPIAD